MYYYKENITVIGGEKRKHDFVQPGGLKSRPRLKSAQYLGEGVLFPTDYQGASWLVCLQTFELP